LLDNGAHIESRDNEYGCTPLYLATANGRTDVVRALVSAGADVNTKTNNGWSALGVASDGHIEVVNILLDNGAHIESRDDCGGTLLWSAARNGSVQIIDLLVEHEADVDAVNYSGFTPVCIAADRGHRDAVKTLLQHGANSRYLDHEYIDPVYRTALLCTRDVKEILELLLNYGLPETATHGVREDTLIDAAERGRVDIVNTLLEYGADMYDRYFENTLPIHGQL